MDLGSRLVRWMGAAALGALLAGCTSTCAGAVATVRQPASGKAAPRAGRHGCPSPDGRYVAFVVPEPNQFAANGSSIWLRELGKGGSVRRLTDSRGEDDFPSFAPDGQNVYFQSDRGGLAKIWVVPVKGGRPAQVTFGASQDYHPAVSPSGRLLAYDSNRSGNYDIWIRDLASGQDRQVTRAPGPDFSPTWAPQEKALAYTSNRDGTFQIWIQRLDLPEALPVKVTLGTAVNAHPSWSPTGKYLAYDSDENGAVKVWVVELKKPNRRFRVTGDPWSEEAPTWASNGERLLFTVKREGATHLATAPLPLLPPQAPGAALAEATLPVVEPVRSRPVSGAGFRADEPLPAEDEAEPPAASFASEEPSEQEPLAVVATAGEVVPSAGAAQPANGLRILQFFPKDAEQGYDPPTSLSVVFSHRLGQGLAVDSLLTLVDESGTQLQLVSSYNPALRRVDAVPKAPLENGHQYKVSVSDGVVGEGGERLPGGFAWSFSTKDLRDKPVASVVRLEDVRFEVAERSPLKTPARPDATVRVRFTKAVDASTVQADSVMLFDERGQKVPGDVRFPEGNDSLELQPYQRLRPGARYRVVVANKVKSVDGEGIPRALVWAFFTGNSTPLTVAEFAPKDFAGAQPEITVTFNRPVDPATLPTGQVLLKGRDQTYTGNTVMASDATSLLFIPHRRLPNKQEFVLLLPAGLADAQGNGLDAKAQLRFQTRYEEHAAASDVGSILAKHGAPATAATADETAKYLSSNRDVNIDPRSWVYRALNDLQKRGLLDKNLCGDLTQGAPLSRYKSALLVESATKSLSLMAPAEVAVLKRLTREFDPELHTLGVKLSGELAPPSNTFVGRG